jgi:hypothetical protein
MTIESVFCSWNSPRAIKYRDINNIADDLGTAVTVQSMVYGNMNIRSGSGYLLIIFYGPFFLIVNVCNLLLQELHLLAAQQLVKKYSMENT